MTVQEGSIATDIATRQLVLRLRQAASSGAVGRWEPLFGELVTAEQAKVTDSLGPLEFRHLLERSAKQLLRGWLDFVKPKRLGGNSSDVYITNEEVDAYLSSEVTSAPFDDVGEVCDCAELICARLVAVATCRGRGPLPTADLVEHFALDPFELCFVLLLFLNQTDPRFRRVSTFALNDFTKKEVDQDLLFGMVFGRPGPLWNIGRLRFHPMAPLLHFRIVDRPGVDESQASVFSGAVRLADSLVLYLDQRAVPAPETSTQMSWYRAAPSSIDDLLDAGLVQGAAQLLRSDHARTVRLVLEGHPDLGRSEYVNAIAAALGAVYIRLDARTVLGAPRSQVNAAVGRLVREARLHRGVILVDLPPEPRGEATGEGPAQVAPDYEALVAALNSYPDSVVVGAEDRQVQALDALSGMIVQKLPVLNTDQRVKAWERRMQNHGLVALGEAKLRELAGRYPLPMRSIDSVVSEAAQRVAMTGAADEGSVKAELDAIARRQTSYRLQSLAERIPVTMGWRDVVLPETTLERLMEIITFARYRTVVFDDWGFGRKLPYGRALSALFHGPPGTGKTMVASVIANDLGRELFRVDLSQITSKWIGETEKNLARIFDEARRHEAVLLFDEADSIFAKRTEVKTSTDRYSNMNVNFLLQAMEEFEGVVLLTSNNTSSIDEAFNRRIRFKVEFPFPDEAQRAELWRSMFPSETTVADDVIFGEFGRAYEMAGGNIKEAALRAAFTAVERGVSIDKAILKQAANRVYQEMGRLVGEWERKKPAQSGAYVEGA